MSQKETYHLPGVTLEIDFTGDNRPGTDLDDFRAGMKRELVQHLIKDGTAFQEADTSANWKAGSDADSHLEASIDAWIHSKKYKATKAKDKHAKKVRWVLACDEQVTLLLQPD